MKRVNLGIGVLFLFFAAFAAFQASNLRYMSALGPGPGFFPLWLAIAFALLSLVWLLQVVRTASGPLPEGFIPTGSGSFRVGSVLVALVAFTFALDLIGFQLAMFFMLIFVQGALGKQHPLVTVVVALLGSFGVFYVFTTWLGVYLPLSSFDWLSGLHL